MAGAAAALGDQGNILGRASPLGPVLSEFYAKQGAKRTATEQTQDFFGLAGMEGKATKGQILAVYNQLEKIDTMEAVGKERVANVIAEDRVGKSAQGIMDDLKFAASHLEEVARQLRKVFTGER